MAGVSVILGAQIMELCGVVEGLASRALPPSISVTEIQFEEPVDRDGSVILTIDEAGGNMPVILADQAALDAWDHDQQRVQAFADATADDERDARDYIREE